MTFELLTFFFFSAVLVFASAMVITIRNPVKAALFLVLAFFSAACLWVLLEAEFLGIVLILVYVGAVMVLFLFVVMMLDVNLARMREGFGEYLPMGAIVAILMVAEMAIVLGSGEFSLANMPQPAGHPEGYSNTKELGRLIYTVYVYPFEIAALILLVAIVAAIALTLRKRPNTKHQNTAQQIQVKRSDRVRLVKMPSEKKPEN
ncbi:MAG TPA: NADH-quinone oxidoreductase subunit J [Acidiferrobacteraceae bacterium]|nr:NADH-quinone oxidoreductase subunit J [Acidiferrobacteraceae bacterium]